MRLLAAIPDGMGNLNLDDLVGQRIVSRLELVETHLVRGTHSSAAMGLGCGPDIGWGARYGTTNPWRPGGISGGERDDA